MKKPIILLLIFFFIASSCLFLYGCEEEEEEDPIAYIYGTYALSSWSYENESDDGYSSNFEKKPNILSDTDFSEYQEIKELLGDTIVVAKDGITVAGTYGNIITYNRKHLNTFHSHLPTETTLKPNTRIELNFNRTLMTEPVHYYINEFSIVYRITFGEGDFLKLTYHYYRNANI